MFWNWFQIFGNNDDMKWCKMIWCNNKTKYESKLFGFQNDVKWWNDMTEYDSKLFGFQNDRNGKMKNRDESDETRSEYYDSETKWSRRQKSRHVEIDGCKTGVPKIQYFLIQNQILANEFHTYFKIFWILQNLQNFYFCFLVAHN